MKTKRCYIAGRLNGMACDYIKNVHHMIYWAEIVRKIGCAVFIPGLDFLCGVIHGDWEYDDYFDNSQPWLAASDCIFVTPEWEESKGTKREIEYAESLGIPVFYDIGELHTWLRRNL